MAAAFVLVDSKRVRFAATNAVLAAGHFPTPVSSATLRS